MAPQFSYIILGAGKQGVAAAYDILKFGNAQRLTLADSRLADAKAAISHLRTLLPDAPAKLAAKKLNALEQKNLVQILRGHHAVLSAVPFYLNPRVARAAIQAGTHYIDLGGYFETTQKILSLDKEANAKGVTLVPDCGVSPGLCNSLAAAGIARLDQTNEVHMYCGGLPQHPKPPLNYKIVFNLEGLLGNYFGSAYVLKDGKISLEPSFSGREVLDFGPLGKLEAVVTGGATSTAPWTYKGKIQAYDYKTLRYPGHYDKIQLLKDLGLLETTPVAVNGFKVAPRDLFVAAAGPRLRFPDDQDLLVMRVIVRGLKAGRPLEIVFDLLDYFDPATGLTAMQRTTGFSAAIVLERLAQGKALETGVVPVEKAVPGDWMIAEIKRRGITVKETTKCCLS